jgi:DNA-binding transcriptional ArsR family regulator
MRFSVAHARELATFFHGLAHPTRLQLVRLLLEEERSVSDLMRALDLPQARVSRHLQALRRCGCCTARQEGSWVYYRARQPHVLSELLQLADTELHGEVDAGLIQ